MGTISDTDVPAQYAAYLRSLVDLAGTRPLKIVVNAGNCMVGMTTPTSPVLRPLDTFIGYIFEFSWICGIFWLLEGFNKDSTCHVRLGRSQCRSPWDAVAFFDGKAAGGMVFLSGVKSFQWPAGREDLRCLAAAQLALVGAAQLNKVAAGFAVTPESLRSWRKLLTSEALAALVPEMKGPQGDDPAPVADAAPALMPSEQVQEELPVLPAPVARSVERAAAGEVDFAIPAFFPAVPKPLPRHRPHPALQIKMKA